MISDAHEGLKAAAAKVLGASWQRCRVHFLRNLMSRVGRQNQPMVSALVRTVFAQQGRHDAHAQWREVADKLRDSFPDVASLMDEAEHDVLAYMAFERDLHTKIHSTNPLEWLNKEIKRRTNVVGIFPNRAAVIRLVGALMLKQNDEWAVSRRYVSMESLKEICDEDEGATLIVAE